MQLTKSDSFPVQPTYDIKMGPVPGPKNEYEYAWAPNETDISLEVDYIDKCMCTVPQQ